MTVEVALNKLLVHAPIGVFDFEKVQGNDFEVNITLAVEVEEEALQLDSLEGVVNYAEIAEMVCEIMKEGCDLIETAAYRIDRVIYSRFKNRIVRSRVEVLKINPPVEGLGSASATICRSFHSNG